jgi:hypothetical protein
MNNVARMQYHKSIIYIRHFAPDFIFCKEYSIPFMMVQNCVQIVLKLLIHLDSNFLYIGFKRNTSREDKVLVVPKEVRKLFTL